MAKLFFASFVSAVIVTIVVLFCVVSCSPVFGQELPVGGPVRDAISNKLQQQNEALTAQRKAITGLSGRFDNQSKRLGLIGTVANRIETEQKNRWQIWQEERTKRNLENEKTRQVLAEVRKAVAEANKHRPMWRFGIVAMGFLAFLMIWLKR